MDKTGMNTLISVRHIIMNSKGQLRVKKMVTWGNGHMVQLNVCRLS